VVRAIEFPETAVFRARHNRRAEAAAAVIRGAESWKADVLKPIRAAAEDKFDRLFDAEQRAYVESRLERIDF